MCEKRERDRPPQATSKQRSNIFSLFFFFIKNKTKYLKKFLERRMWEYE